VTPNADSAAQHLHDYRVNRSRGKQVAKIPRAPASTAAATPPRAGSTAPTRALPNPVPIKRDTGPRRDP
jgi:hypothetical protein